MEARLIGARLAATRLTGPLAAALSRRRDDYNARFRRARAAAPHIDAEAFSAHLSERIGPAVDAAAIPDPGSADRVTSALYDLSLELFASDLLGPRARYPAIPEAWRRLLPVLPELVRLEPRRVAASITNAVFVLSCAPGARPGEWIEALELASASAAIDSLDTFLAAGRVAAWRAGLAHLRARALSTARGIPAGVARACLRLPDLPDDQIPAILDALERDPWLDPSAPADPARRVLRAMGHAGEFRGFGGTFDAPPVVEGTVLVERTGPVEGTGAAAGGASETFLVRDGQRRWALCADRFGSSLLPAAAQAEAGVVRGLIAIDSKGRVSAGVLRADLGALADPTGFASTATTLAVSIARSHSVYLVGIDAPPPAGTVSQVR